MEFAGTSSAQVRDRDTNSIALMGDSRNDMQTADPARMNLSRRHYTTVANQMLGSALNIPINTAVSGTRSDQNMTQAYLDTIIASNVGWVIYSGVINDVAQGFTAAQAWGGFNGSIGLKAGFDQLIAAGIRLILVLEPGSVGVSGSLAMVAEIAKYNALLRSYAVSHQRVHLLDMPTIVLNPTSAGIAFKAGYSIDGTHYSNTSAVYQGQALVGILQPYVAPRAWLPASQAEKPGDGVNFIANGLFTATTGGSVGSGSVTGSVPASFVYNADASISATLSTAAGAVGNDLTISVTASAAGDLRLGQDMFNESPGDSVYAAIGMDIAAGSVNFEGPRLLIQANRDPNVVTAFDGYCQGFGNQPAIAQTGLVMRTPTIVVPPGARAWFTMFVGLSFSGAGSATVKLRQVVGQKAVQS